MSSKPARQFVKKFQTEDLEFQIAKENQLATIFADSKLLKAPKLLHCDRDQSELTFEFIEDLVSFRSLLGNMSLASELASRVGNGIAKAHQHLEFPDSAKIRLPAPYEQFKTENAFLHLDLSTVNVQYSPSKDCVYLIDWELSPLLKSNANFGSIYFDLCFFCSNLFMIEPYIFTKAKAKADLSQSFLRSYQTTYGNLDFDEFRRVGMAHSDNRRHLDSRLVKRLVCWRNHSQFRSFISDLPAVLA